MAAGVVPPPTQDPSTILGAALVGWWNHASLMWQDSARTIPVTADGQPVGAWDTVAGGATNSLAQATAGSRPIFKTNQDGVLPAVRFVGVNNVSSTFLQNAATATVRPSAAWVVFRPSGTETNSLCDKATLEFSMNLTKQASGLRIFVQGLNGTPHGSPIVGQWNFGAGSFGTGALNIVGLDGVTYAPESATASATGAGFLIGASGNGNLASPLSGEIIAVVLSNAIPTLLQFDDMFRYFTSIYGAAPPGPGDPSEISPGLVAWLDFTDIGSLFQDQSGTVPVTANAQPIKFVVNKAGGANPNDPVGLLYAATGGPNGTPCATGNGTNNSLGVNAPLGTQHTLFASFKCNSTGFTPIVGGEGSAGTYWMPRTAAGEVNYFALGSNATFLFDLGAIFHTIILTRSGTTVNLYVDGVLRDSPRTLPTDLGFTILAVMNYANSIYGNGNMPEVGAYSAVLDAAQVAELDLWLNRHGIHP